MIPISTEISDARDLVLQVNRRLEELTSLITRLQADVLSLKERVTKLEAN